MLGEIRHFSGVDRFALLYQIEPLVQLVSDIAAGDMAKSTEKVIRQKGENSRSLAII